jgi:hypothetical protein
VSAAAYLLVAIAYVNGVPVQTEVGEIYANKSECVDMAKKSLATVSPQAPHQVEFVFKCVDISQVDNAAAGFGLQK